MFSIFNMSLPCLFIILFSIFNFIIFFPFLFIFYWFFFFISIPNLFWQSFEFEDFSKVKNTFTNLFNKLTGNEDITVATPVSGRSAKYLETIVIPNTSWTTGNYVFLNMPNLKFYLYHNDLLLSGSSTLLCWNVLGGVGWSLFSVLSFICS